MSLFAIAFLMINPWLHDYSAPKNWTNKYDRLYKKTVVENGLGKHRITWHLLKTIAVIESCQNHKLKGGGGNSFWGLFQMSSTLAKQFGKQSHRRMLDPERNAKTFGKWVKFYIEKVYAPMLLRRTATYRKITQNEWESLIYAGHNIGPYLVRWSLLYQYPLRWLARKMVQRRGRKDGLYRMSLFLLTPVLVKGAHTGNMGSPVFIKWWNRRDLMLKIIGYGDGSLRWSERTAKISLFQSSNGLPVTGIWDSLTEDHIIRKVLACQKRKRKPLPGLLQKLLRLKNKSAKSTLQPLLLRKPIRILFHPHMILKNYIQPMRIRVFWLPISRPWKPMWTDWDTVLSRKLI